MARRKFPRLDPTQARTRALSKLPRLVRSRDFARPLGKEASVGDFLDSLPAILAARELRELARAIAQTHRAGRTVLLMTGAHSLKTGLSPLIVQWLREGVLSALALNGAGMIHDFELAWAGRTSEDVGAGLADGSFGMAEETGAFLNSVAQQAAREGHGLGEVAGREIVAAKLEFRALSVLAAAYEAGAPATVHVALGTDIIHMHPKADGGAIGQATLKDFHRLTEVVATLSRGVVLNLGSAVILPEVFVKALNLARNLGRRVERLTSADMDFLRHYRPRVNVLQRPTEGDGRAIALTGHHEIMFPLLAAAVAQELGR